VIQQHRASQIHRHNIIQDDREFFCDGHYTLWFERPSDPCGHRRQPLLQSGLYTPFQVSLIFEWALRYMRQEKPRPLKLCVHRVPCLPRGRNSHSIKDLCCFPAELAAAGV